MHIIYCLVGVIKTFTLTPLKIVGAFGRTHIITRSFHAEQL